MKDNKIKKEKEIRILKEKIKELEKAEAEHKQAEAVLRESEEKYRTLVESLEEGITAIDENENFTFVNLAACKTFGYSKKELLQMNFKEILKPEDHQRMLQQTAIRKTRESSEYDLNVIHKDGSQVIISVTATPVIDNNGEYKGSFGLFHDITERKRTDEELKKHHDNLEELVKKRTFILEEKTKEIKESQQALSLLLEDVNESRASLKNLNKQLNKEIQERKLKGQKLEAKTNELNISLKKIENAKDNIDAILKSIGEGIIVTDLDNKVILMNNVAEDLLNIRLSEILNKPLDFIFDKKLREKFNFTIPEIGKGYQFDFELLSKKFKAPLIYNATASLIKDKKDKVTGIITTFHDVTQEHKINQMKTNFISTAAHELRTPLTSIQGFSEILKIRDDLDDEKKKRFLTYINNQAVNLGNIISDLLDISRIESGMGFNLKKEKCKINDCILRIFSIYKISHPNHSFYFYLPDKETEVFVDRVKMEQIIENILSNAVKYSPHGSEIRIKGKVLGNKYMVTLEDKGIGMTPEQVKRIYEKFFRGDSSDTATEGTGLGMSIVKYIIEAHKGNIWVESKLGKGTKVCFTIPISIRLEKDDKKKK